MENTLTTTLKINSPAFKQDGWIPKEYTCDGRNVNPELHIGKLPEGTESLVLFVDDPDAPAGTWDHWIVWNIPPQNDIKENAIPGMQGLNSFQQHDYRGPCPPLGSAHRYFFKIYALDCSLSLKPDSQKTVVERAMNGHVLAYGELIGLYKRKG